MSVQPPGDPPPPPPPGPPPGNPYPPQGYSGPQPPWPAGPPPTRRSNGWKWGLGALALLVVIGVTAAVTISVTKGRGDGGSTPTGETFGLASADDKGPVNVITEDPSCAAWGPISQTFVDIQQKGWADRDAAIPATDWTPSQRTQYEEMRVAARHVADESVQLTKLTPHRVMRELYEAYIAYARAYSEAIPNYTAQDNHLAGVMNSAGSVITYACAAITYKSAQSRGPLVPAPSPSAATAPVSNPDDPSRFLKEEDSTCKEWVPLLERYIEDVRPWQAIEPAIAASDWSAEQRNVIGDTIPLMEKYADSIEELGRKSANPVVQDLAVLSSQYRRAYAAALPTYTGADAWLDSTAHRTTSIIYEACKAAGA